MKWTKVRLEDLISKQIEESLHLEYKSSGAIQNSNQKKESISKFVSAFANSDGGTLIYGIKEFDEKNKQHLPEKIDPINASEYGKEWLEQIIVDSISPKIIGLEIIPVTIIKKDQMVVYVINVPKSNTAHQAKDFRYYKRNNFKVNPMNDYEVRDVMNRTTSPILKLGFEARRSFTSKMKNQVYNYYLIPRIENIGTKVARFVKANVYLPSSFFDYTPLLSPGRKTIDGLEYLGFSIENGIRDSIITRPTSSLNIGNVTINRQKDTIHQGPKRYEPILPELDFQTNHIELNKDIWSQEFMIHWEVFADNSQVRTGSINFSDVKAKK